MWNKFLHNPLHIVKDYELRKLLWQSGGGTAVCKKYLKFRDTAPKKLTFPETQVDEPIWLFWNTGLDKAPEIVRTCYQSVKKYAGRQVVLLTEKNVQNYINMPDYLNEKLKSGVLPLAIYAFGSGNLSSIHLVFRHLIDFLAVQHQMRCKSVWLIKTDLLICNCQRLIQRVQVHKNLMLQIMPQSVPADHLLCLRIKMTVDKNQWLIKVE